MNVNMASDNDHFGMNFAGGGPTIHFSLQGKGGVGKSVVASWLAGSVFPVQGYSGDLHRY